MGKADNPRRVLDQDRLVRPNLFFHQPSDDMKTIREEWEIMRKEMQDAVGRQIMSLVTPHFDMGSNDIKQQLVLQPDVVEKPMIKVIENQPPTTRMTNKIQGT